MTRDERKIQWEIEKAFRRGFSHGFLVGRTIENGLTEKDVLKWRHDKHKGQLTPPGMGLNDHCYQRKDSK